MPIVTVDSEDLKSLIGRKVSDEELKRILPLNKLLIEDWKGTELKLEVTPDRPDLFSAEGVARQLSAWLGVRPGLQKFQVAEPKIAMNASRSVLRPFVTCAAVRNLRMTNSMIKSIMQLQETLDLTLGRDRKKVAIGLHDISKVTQPFFYKDVSPDEVSFVPLNSKKRMTLSEIVKRHPKGIQYARLVEGEKKWPVFLDSNGQVLSSPPIINGELTKVTEDTTDFFIDITGSDDKAINKSLNILVTALEKRGGKIEGVNINGTVKPDLSPKLVNMNPDDARRILGLEISNRDMESLLERAGYSASIRKNMAEVMVPAYRADILHPVDIIEDIAIAYGFSDIIAEMPKLHSIGEANAMEELSNRVRELMVGLGFQEAINYTLTSAEKQFARMEATGDAVEISNPMSQEYSACRRWLLPSLLENLKMNKHRRFPQRIFEISDSVVPDHKADNASRNVRKLCCAITHPQASLSEIISILNSIRDNLGAKWEIRSYRHGSFIEGRCGAVFLQGQKEPVGIFGEISPKVLLNFELNNPAAALELDAQKIAEQLGI